METTWVVVGLLMVACGRIGYVGTTTDSDSAGDGQPASCIGLPARCGPIASISCCDSPIVIGGTFFRGYDVAADSTFKNMTRPATVATFRLDRYEVTVGRFRQFVNAGMGTQQNPPAAGASAHPQIPASGWNEAWNASLVVDTPALIAGLKCDASYQTWTDSPGANENLPIVCITWHEAMAFCAWDGGFLPTEAEWHYAASGGDEQRAYPWSSPPGSTSLDCTLADYSGCVSTGANAVGTTSSTSSGLWGQEDLGGNVWEWVLDWYATAYPSPCDNCANLVTASQRVLRGGSFIAPAASLRAASRDVGEPSIRPSASGVRCARTPEF